MWEEGEEEGGEEEKEEEEGGEEKEGEEVSTVARMHMGGTLGFPTPILSPPPNLDKSISV